ncbi:hypothetical protein ACN28I_00115 [Archangium gephyra]|uniref:hypothetical protein n=1 Tax=Archangium gephyra TaxID=48 RepID=UPI003B7F474F
MQTTGVIPVCLCMISAIDDPSIRSHLPRLLEMAHQVAICVRLANDLRTYEKELRPGEAQRPGNRAAGAPEGRQGARCGGGPGARP